MHHNKKTFSSILAIGLAFSLSSSSLVQAGTVYELYQLVEEPASESGYIPAYDPAKDLEPADSGTGDSSSVSPEQSISDGEKSGIDNSIPVNPSFDDGALTDPQDGSDVPSGEPDFSDDQADLQDSEVSVFSAEPEADHTDNLYTASDLPSRYSLSDSGVFTPVKDQSFLQICWAFSALESIETGLIKKGLADSSLSLSESHLAYSAFHGLNDNPLDATREETFYPDGQKWTAVGGNKYHTTATLARGYGVAYDSQFPLSLAKEAHFADAPGSYDSILDAVFTDEAKTTSVARLKNCYWLNEINYPNYNTMSRVSRINNVKRFIMNYGAVEIGIYSKAYDKETNSFYSETSIRPEHAVTLVGWDDNKMTKASVPGAFLVQNSWGTNQGENGLFWLSYEDRSMQSPSFYEMENEPLGQVSNRIISQYDGTGYGSVLKPVDAGEDMRISGANVFTSSKDQYLKEISFYAGASSLPYTISIYRYVNSSPDTGTLVHRQSGKNTYSGYYSIDLTKPVPIAKGEKFAVELMFDNKNGYVPHENAAGRIFTSSPGESYLCDGSEWNDLFDMGFHCNLCIKAIGTASDTAISMKPSKPEFASVKVIDGNRISVALKETKEDVDGFDFVIGTSPSFLKTRSYEQISKNVKTPKTTFNYIRKGTYFLAVHSYRLNGYGDKVFSPWSDVYTIKIQGITPGTPKIKSCKVSGNTLTATYGKASNAGRYEYVLSKKKLSSTTLTPSNRYRLGTNRKYGTAKFTKLPKGTYYFGVRAYTTLNKSTKVRGKWAVKKVIIK